MASIQPDPTRLRVAMFVQKVDEHDWLLSFTLDWLRALAARVARLDVVTLENRATPGLLPENVTLHSLGKERQVGRLTELINFQRIVARLAPQSDVFFSHLTPRFTWLAAPFARLHHVPQCMWYTHRQTNRELRLALRCAKWVATAVPSSFPLPSPKVHVLGHGIDADFFSPSASVPSAEPPLILAVGRLAPIKRHDVLIEAAALLRDRGIAAQFAIAGAVASSEGAAYQTQLNARIAELKLTDQVRLLGGLDREALLNEYRRASVVTNLSPVGLFDKAALEAMCTARPVLVTNPAFDEVLGDQVALLRLADPPQPSVVVDKLAALLEKSPSERDQIGHNLRQRTAQIHGLAGLMDRLVALWTNS